MLAVMERRDEVTALLAQVNENIPAAFDRLYGLVYEELRRLAQSQLRGERADHTLQATALVHESYLRLVVASQVQWNDRSHFFAAAARAMRRILIDHARARASKKRGGHAHRTSLVEIEDVAAEARPVDLIALDEALQRLSRTDEVTGRVVELRYFGGLTSKEASEVLGLSQRAVERHWTYARAWLFRALSVSQEEKK